MPVRGLLYLRLSDKSLKRDDPILIASAFLITLDRTTSNTKDII